MDSGQHNTTIPPLGSMAIIFAVLFPSIVVLLVGKFPSAAGSLLLVAASWLIYMHRQLLRAAWAIPRSRRTLLIASAISTALFISVLLGPGNNNSSMQLQDYLLVAWVFVLPIMTRRISLGSAAV